MARKGLEYLAKRLRQIMILTIGSILFIGLCFMSLTQAENGKANKATKEGNSASPTKVMQILMEPTGKPIDKCEIPISEFEKGECKTFFNINEDVLQNLFSNYSECLSGSTYYLNFSNRRHVKITNPLVISSKGKEKLSIEGLKLIASKKFP